MGRPQRWSSKFTGTTFRLFAGPRKPHTTNGVLTSASEWTTDASFKSQGVFITCLVCRYELQGCVLGGHRMLLWSGTSMAFLRKQKVRLNYDGVLLCNEAEAYFVQRCLHTFVLCLADFGNVNLQTIISHCIVCSKFKSSSQKWMNSCFRCSSHGMRWLMHQWGAMVF